MESIDELKRDLQEHLSATSGVTGSGTVACRLWNAINNVLFALKKGQVAKDIAELEAENKKLSAFITMEHTDPPYDYGDSQDVQFAIRIAELEAQLAAAQERNTKLQSEHLDHVAVLHKRIKELEARLAAAQEQERWIPVTEARPERAEYVEVISFMQYDGEDHWLASGGNLLEPGSVSAWRTIPREAEDEKK